MIKPICFSNLLITSKIVGAGIQFADGYVIPQSELCGSKSPVCHTRSAVGFLGSPLTALIPTGVFKYKSSVYSSNPNLLRITDKLKSTCFFIFKSF